MRRRWCATVRGLGAIILLVFAAGCGGRSSVDPGEPVPEPATLDLEAGWTLVEDYAWPIQPGCCGMNTVGPTSPEGSIPADAWPADGFYEVDALRPPDTTVLHLTVRRWVACRDLADAPCAPDPEPDPATGEDLRITGDPASEVARDVPIADLGVVLVPIHDVDGGVQRAIAGEPGALAVLLEHGIDAAYRQWILEPYLEGVDIEEIRHDLLDQSVDPEFPFGTDYDSATPVAGPVAYRGPFGTSLLADPAWGGWQRPDRTPPGPDGLYGWHGITLEIRDGEPILHLWAGQIAG